MHSRVLIICFSCLSCMYRSLSSKLSCRSFSHILLSERRFILSLETWRTEDSLTEFSWWSCMTAVSQWLIYNFSSSTLMMHLLMQTRESWQCSLTELQYSRSSHFHLSHCYQRFQNHRFSRCRLCVSCACSLEAQWEFEDHQHSCALFCLCLCISSQAFKLQTDESNRLNDVHLHRENILKIITIDDDAIDRCRSLKDFCNNDWFCVCFTHSQCAYVRFLAWLITQSLLSSIVLSSFVTFEVSS